MCGIVGIVDVDGNEGLRKEQVFSMSGAIAHRGPDDDGFIQNGKCTLAHRRLSIIDLEERSKQPMSDVSQRYTIVFNGEIYNFKSLKKELKEYPFHTESDTEVLLAAYIKWGKACLDQLQGMFAFAIWDNQEETLFAARDRMGIKPFYYHLAESQQQLYFSSELRGLMACGFRKLNREQLSEYVQYQCIAVPNTILKDVYALEPGSFLTFDGETGLTIQRYWKPTVPEKPIRAKAPEKEIRQLLEQAVTDRMVADVPIAAFLSGGIDSSIVATLMAQSSGQKIDAFSIGFQEEQYSELKYAETIAQKSGLNFHPIVLEEKKFKTQVREALDALDNPGGDGPNSYVIAEEVRKAGIKVALSGLGGDELFFGYSNIFYETYSWNHIFSKNPWVGKLLQKFPDGLHAKLPKLKGLAKADSLYAAYRAMRSVIPAEQTEKLLNVSLNQESDEEGNRLTHISTWEMQHYLEPVLLRDTDQMSMANALEVRVPFLDHRLVEYVLQLSDKSKTGKPKELLLKSVEDILPASLFDRPKMGFTFPWAEWLKGELKEFTTSRLNTLAESNFIEAEPLNAYSDAFFKQGKITWSRIWHLVVLAHWMELNNIE
tara:strand:- start:17 stop:1819 length:1803 start_codon:yes stop_codon:yes gene_type:complete